MVEMWAREDITPQAFIFAIAISRSCRVGINNVPTKQVRVDTIYSGKRQDRSCIIYLIPLFDKLPINKSTSTSTSTSTYSSGPLQ